MSEFLMEQALKDIYKRLEALEKAGNRPNSNDFNQNRQFTPNPNKLATEKQIIAIDNMGGKTWKGMTQKDAEDQFKECRENFQQNKIGDNSQSPRTSAEGPSFPTSSDTIFESGEYKNYNNPMNVEFEEDGKCKKCQRFHLFNSKIRTIAGCDGKWTNDEVDY